MKVISSNILSRIIEIKLLFVLVTPFIHKILRSYTENSVFLLHFNEDINNLSIHLTNVIPEVLKLF